MAAQKDTRSDIDTAAAQAASVDETNTRKARMTHMLNEQVERENKEFADRKTAADDAKKKRRQDIEDFLRNNKDNFTHHFPDKPRGAQEDKSIYGAIEHTMSWNEEGIAWWAAFTVLKFSFDISVGWMVDYYMMKSKEAQADALGSLFKPNADGQFPTLIRFGDNGKPLEDNDGNYIEYTHDEKKELYQLSSSVFGSDAAATILQNGLMPPVSGAIAYAKQFAKISESFWGEKHVMDSFPEFYSQVHQRFANAEATSRQGMDHSDDGGKMNLLNQKPTPASTSGSGKKSTP